MSGGVFLRRRFAACVTLRRRCFADDSKKKIEYYSVNAFGEPREKDSFQSYADLFRVVSKEDAVKLGVKRSTGWRIYVTCLLMTPVVFLIYVAKTTEDFMKAEETRLELEQGQLTPTVLSPTSMFRGNAHNTRTPDTYSDAQVTEYIKELSKSLDETREELAKLRAAQQQSSSSSSSSQTPPSAK